MNILFVCSANLNRSKAFEREFKAYEPNAKVQSAGCWYGYPNQIDEKILSWAKYIYVMDLSHKKFIHEKYPEHLDKVIVIGISDQYDVDDDELKKIFEYWWKFER